MCGILGNVSVPGPGLAVVLDAIGSCSTARSTRKGVIATGPIALTTRRFGIVDLETNDQPVSDGASDVAAICNREVYDYREHRSGLDPNAGL